MMTVQMTHESSPERSPLGDPYVRHAPEGIRPAFLLTGDRALAEDLVQEAFARLVGRLSHLRDPGAFGAPKRPIPETCERGESNPHALSGTGS